jgi:mono/diheme cytochrome c family protein
MRKIISRAALSNKYPCPHNSILHQELMNMKQKALLFTIAIHIALFALAAPPVEEGKSIFAARCAACHNINKVITGPALAGVDRRRSMDWIINFVHASQVMVKGGDKDAVALFNQFNRIPMPDHPDLTDDNIRNIVEYIKSESKEGVETVPFARPSKIRPAYTPLSINNYWFFITFLGLVALLVAALLTAVRVKQYERRGSDQK